MELRDKIFTSYHKIHGKFLDGEINANLQKWFNSVCDTSYLEHLSNRHEQILEIGCGKGYILKWLKEKKYLKIEGIDLSPDDVEMAKKYVGIDNIYCVDTFIYLQGKRSVYDCILGKDILEHIEKDKLDEFLNIIKDALKPNGRVIFQVPNMDWIMAPHERYMDLTHEVGFTKESLADFLRLYFDDVKIYPVGYNFYSSIKGKIISKFVSPIAINLTRLWLKILGAGAGDCWFEYREILGVGKK